MQNPHLLIALMGPTAVGKTQLAIQLAQHFSTEIVSADARQFYDEMYIGTARPTPEEISQATHHLVGHISIHQSYNAGQFDVDAQRTLSNLFESHPKIVMVGGSGMYLKAAFEGFDALPEVPASVRDQLNQLFQAKGIAALQQKLAIADPAYYAQVDLQNPQRLIRALEICAVSDQPYSFYRRGKITPRPYTIVKLGIERDRADLYARIDQRVHQMINGGLIEEAQRLHAFRHLNALKTVGYTELFDYFEGKTDLNVAIAKIQQNTRNYAKRQMTWFKKDPQTRWFHATDISGILHYLQSL